MTTTTIMDAQLLIINIFIHPWMLFCAKCAKRVNKKVSRRKQALCRILTKLEKLSLLIPKKRLNVRLRAEYS